MNKQCFKTEIEAAQFAKDLTQAKYEVQIVKKDNLYCVSFNFSAEKEFNISKSDIKFLRETYGDY